MNHPARPLSANLGLLAASIIFLAPLLLLTDVRELNSRTSGWQPVGLRGERVLALSVASSGGEQLLYAETQTGWWRHSQVPGKVRGFTWQRLDGPLPHTPLGGPALAAWRVVPGRARQLFALTGAGTARLLYRSDDGGDSWTMIGPAPGQTARPPMIVFPGPSGAPETITVVTDTRIQRSTDGGATWAPGGAWPQPQTVCALLSDSEVRGFASTPERLYALGERGDFWLSESGGLAWRTPPPPLPAPPEGGEKGGVTALAIAPHFGVRIWAAMPDRLAYSADSGGNWTTLPLPRPHVRVAYLLVDLRVPDTLYASLADGAVYRSDDVGASWIPLGKPGTARAGALALDPDTRGQLYAATEDGVWVRPVVAPQPTALPEGAESVDRLAKPRTPLTEQPATLTPGATASPTGTATATPRPTDLSTVTPSPSPSPSATQTSAPTVVALATPTATPTKSPTRRPSRTPLPPTRPVATPTATGAGGVASPTAAPREPAPTVPAPTAVPTAPPPTAQPPTATAVPPTETPQFFTPEPR